MRHMAMLQVIGALALAAAAVPAHACVPALYYTGDLQDPDEAGLDSAERARREALVRAHLSQQAAHSMELRARDAAHWEHAAPAEQARWLFDLVVPLPVVSNSLPCTYGPEFPDPQDAQFRQAMDQLAADAPEGLGTFEATRDFWWGYQQVALGCNGELRDRFTPVLLEELPAPIMGRVLGRFMLYGIYPAPWGRGDKLFRYAEGPGSNLVLNRRRWEGSGSPRLWREAEEAEFRRDWPQARAFWRRDPDALAAIAATERALGRLVDRALPYQGLCPATVGRIDELARQQRAAWPQMLAGQRGS